MIACNAFNACIPSAWKIKRVKAEFISHKDIVGEKVNDYERLALTLNGVIRRSKEDDQGLQPEKFDGYQILRKNELVFKLIDLENVNTSTDERGLLDVLRKGFKHRGISFRVCYFKPESELNETDLMHYRSNVFEVYRQWAYSNSNHNTVDMVLVLNGIPVFAFELKNQYTGQSVDNAMRQWMYDRDPREVCFQFNKRVLAYFCVDHTDVMMTTKLAGKRTYFLPFNQGSNGAGNDGGRGNPANPNGYPTSYLWEYVFEKDSIL